MQQLKLPYFVDALSVGYSLLLIAFVQMGAAILRWTARLIVTRKRDEKEEVDTMTPLLLVAFPQWMLCLATIWTAVLNSHARDAPTGTYVALTKSLVTICIPLLAILRAFHQATHMIDNVQEQKEDLLQKKEEHAQKILALTRNVHHRRIVMILGPYTPRIVQKFGSSQPSLTLSSRLVSKKTP
eukprot:scaffold5194_cov118-Cylindrotheca_fusiformis.AAC.4